jgi:hypothetical protein
MNKKQLKREMLLNFLAHTGVKETHHKSLTLRQRLRLYGNNIGRSIISYQDHQWLKALLKPAKAAMHFK